MKYNLKNFPNGGGGVSKGEFELLIDVQKWKEGFEAELRESLPHRGRQGIKCDCYRCKVIKEILGE